MEESDKLCGERSGTKGQSVPWLSPDIIISLSSVIVPVREGDLVRVQVQTRSGEAEWTLGLEQETCQQRITEKIGETGYSGERHEIL